MSIAVSSSTSLPPPKIPFVPPQDPELYSLLLAAQKLSVSKRTLERLIAAGAFPPPVKIGRASRVMRADIAKYLDQLRRDRGDKIGTS